MMRKCPAQHLRFHVQGHIPRAKCQMHTHVSAITKKLLRQIYEKECPVNDLDCFFLCQDYYRLSASRGEGPSGAFVTHCYISCSQYVYYI